MLDSLRSLGYTEDEARFLYVVALHSGYFSARQYLTFTGAKTGEKNIGNLSTKCRAVVLSRIAPA